MKDLHYITGLTWDELNSIGILMARENIYPFTNRKIIAIEKYKGKKKCDSKYYGFKHNGEIHNADLKLTVLYNDKQYYNYYICKESLINSMNDYFKKIMNEIKKSIR